MAALNLTAEELLADKETLTAVLTYHVVPGFYTADDILASTSVIESPTVNGQKVLIDKNGGAPKINDANIVQTDVFGTNGVIHVIDKVLLPQ